MGKPYSLDFRKRVVAAVVTGGLSCNEAGKQFGVAVSTGPLDGYDGSERPAASCLAKWEGTGRRRFLANTVSGCWNGSRQAISPYAGWLPNSPNAG